MKQIKIRVWDTETKIMIMPREDQEKTWYLCDEYNVLSFPMEVPKGFDSIGQGKERFVRMLYTGLKDVNGVEIYEGDLLKKKNGTVYEIFWDDETAMYAVKVVKSSSTFNATLHLGLKFPLNLYASRYYHDSKIEVIGNIYEGQQ